MPALPESVTNLLKSSRFLHLATCSANIPHVSLMNYTYYHAGDGDYLIISTPKTTTKYENIVANDNVSVLFHDWISAKNDAPEKSADSEASPRRNSLYEILANINKSELSRVSVMISGKARILSRDVAGDQYEFYQSLHLNNTKIDEVQAKNYIECADNALVVIKIEGVKVTDTDNNIAEY